MRKEKIIGGNNDSFNPLSAAKLYNCHKFDGRRTSGTAAVSLQDRELREVYFGALGIAMPGTSDTHLGEALLRFVQSDAYPETEEVISSKLPSSALPVVVDILHKARQDVKVRGQKLRPCASC